MLYLLLHTGQRRGNVLGKRWSAHDLHASFWTLPVSESKQRKVRSTPLNTQVRLVLARRAESRGTSDYVFPAARRWPDGADGRMTETNLR